MKFLEDIQLSDNEYGIQLVVILASGWKEAARKFPKERINQILAPKIGFADRRLEEMKERVELAVGEYGLMHISLTPERAGLDLFPNQNSYIGHNLTKSEQVAGVMAIILDYIKLLECL
ncbi:hypothetical protein HYW76_03525 [Candidatus Pacearchaeota archaeon]|nr:hypothetical protein [Candidatus Pacearchaeota archaeon]